MQCTRRRLFRDAAALVGAAVVAPRMLEMALPVEAAAPVSNAYVLYEGSSAEYSFVAGLNTLCRQFAGPNGFWWTEDMKRYAVDVHMPDLDGEGLALFRTAMGAIRPIGISVTVNRDALLWDHAEWMREVR